MTFSSRPFWRATAQRAAVAAMVSALCLAGSATLAVSAHAAVNAQMPVNSAAVAALVAAPAQRQVTENNPSAPPTFDVGPSASTPAEKPAKPAPTADVPAAAEKAPVVAEPLTEKKETTVASPEPSTAAPVISETPWPTFTPTETPQVFVPAQDRSKATAAATGAELSLTSETSGGVGLMTWMLLLLGVTLLAGLGVGGYALIHVRGRHQGE